MKNVNRNHIFIDTNVLIGAYSHIEKDKIAIKYLYSLTGKKLYVSSLTIAQIASVFQKRKKQEEIKAIIEDILKRVTIVDFTKNDIEKSLVIPNADIEDNMQYVISSKMKCLLFVTNNIKDYRVFNNIDVISSKEIRLIKR